MAIFGPVQSQNLTEQKFYLLLYMLLMNRFMKRGNEFSNAYLKLLRVIRLILSEISCIFSKKRDIRLIKRDCIFLNHVYNICL